MSTRLKGYYARTFFFTLNFSENGFEDVVK